jgi:hypothetical protein
MVKVICLSHHGAWQMPVKSIQSSPCLYIWDWDAGNQLDDKDPTMVKHWIRCVNDWIRCIIHCIRCINQKGLIEVTDIPHLDSLSE